MEAQELKQQGELTYPANSVDNFSQALFWQMVNEYTMGGPTDFDSCAGGHLLCDG